jgi:hypothetical protein
MEPIHLSPPTTCCPVTGPSPHMRQLLDSSTWHQQQLIQLAAFLTPPTHSALFHSWNYQFPPQEYLKELRILLFQRALYNYHAVMYLKKEIIVSIFIITISASNLYMPMIWLFVFLLDFLIPFLCDPGLQCVRLMFCSIEKSINLP